MKEKRVEGLDTFRGWALLFMILYHFTYDLNHFRFISVDMNHTTLFLLFRYTIMTMFLLTVGISLALVHQNGINYKSIKKRTLQLGIASLVVTVATYVEFPYSWVYFGILHFILVASLLALPFLNYPKVTLFTAIIILLGSYLNILNMNKLFIATASLLPLPRYTEDLVPLTPWFAIVLLGIFLFKTDIYKKIFQHSFFEANRPINRFLKFMGRHSLVIYLIHQPILFAGFMLFSKV